MSAASDSAQMPSSPTDLSGRVDRLTCGGAGRVRQAKCHPSNLPSPGAAYLFICAQFN